MLHVRAKNDYCVLLPKLTLQVANNRIYVVSFIYLKFIYLLFGVTSKPLNNCSIQNSIMYKYRHLNFPKPITVIFCPIFS